jgi:hypothetical protein
MNLDKNKTGLIIGAFFAVIHFIWSILVLIIPQTLQKTINWIFTIHALEPVWVITSFNFMNMIWLLIVTFIIGYIFGWIFAIITNYIHKK